MDAGGGVVKSERSSGGSTREWDQASKKRGVKEVAESAVQEFLADGRTSDLARARLMEWVLELDASEFPEVMETLARLTRLDPEVESGFGVIDFQTDYVGLGLKKNAAVLERFGIQEEVFEVVARTNEASLKELQRRLGVEE